MEAVQTIRFEVVHPRVPREGHLAGKAASEWKYNLTWSGFHFVEYDDMQVIFWR